MVDRAKLIEKCCERLGEVEEILAKPEIVSDQKQYRVYSQEHSRLLQIKNLSDSAVRLEKTLADNLLFMKDETDEAFLQDLEKENTTLREQITALNTKLDVVLIPPGPHDHANIILEIRAGAGGQEAMLFVADCVRMYQMYANRMGWKFEPLSCTESELKGFKEYVAVLSGENVFRYMQFESGTHRVQRVPDTEAQGRVHTSTITVAVLIEPEEDEKIELDETELRIETTRSTGAGGQHVNKTDSAVRITHLPTGLVVFCQEERSQHKNKDKAMRYLKAKIAEAESRKRKEEIDSKRAMQVGSGDRSEKIRTYNFSQSRVSDHRVNLTKYNLSQVLDGDLEEFSQALLNNYQSQLYENEINRSNS